MLGLTPWKVQPLCPCFTLPLDYAQSGWTRQSLFLWESGSGNRRFLHYFPQGSWANPEKNLPLSRKQTQLKILLLVPTPPILILPLAPSPLPDGQILQGFQHKQDFVFHLLPTSREQQEVAGEGEVARG